MLTPSPRNPRALAAVVSLALLSCAAPAAADGAADPPAPPPPPMRSQPMVAGGVILTVAGAAAATLGAVRLTTATLCTDACANPRGNQIVGGVILGAGIGLLAGGVTLLVIGSRRVPAPGPPAALGAPGGAGWVWRF